MAKKKSSLANFLKSKPKRKNPATGIIDSVIPAGLRSDVVSFVAPAAGGYVATRVVGRLARGVTAAKYPRLSRHASPLASLLTLAAIYIAVKKVKKLSSYETPIVSGAVIAIVQSVIQTYLPRLLWLFDMAPPAIAAPTPAATGDDWDEYAEYDEPAQAPPQLPASQPSMDEDEIYTGNFARKG